MRRALVVLQVAVSCALLVAAGLLGRSLLASRDLNIGIASAGVLTVHADAGTLGEEEATIRAFWHALRERTGALPGVAETSLTLFVPLAGRSDQMLAAPADSPDQPRPTQYNLTGPGYLRLLGIDLVAGRGFDARDIDGGADVAIVNERLASDWLQDEPLGRSLRIVDRGGLQRLVTVVGVAEDSTYRRLGEPPTPYIYLPETQWYRPDLVLLARARAATDTAAAVTSIGRSLLPGLPLRIESMRQAMGFAFIVPRVLSTTFATAGGMGLVLATIGLFGVESHLTQQRIHEFGVRAAVGAQARDLRKLVLLSALRLSALGLVLGLLLALASGRLLASFLFGVGASDPLTYALVAIVLLVATGAASYQPARRAMRLDPVQVLRSE